MSISDRITDNLAWDTLSLDQWDRLLAEMLHRRDVAAVPKVLALMAVHGYAEEAENIRRAILLMRTSHAHDEDEG